MVQKEKQQVKRIKRPVHGVLLLNKPLGLSSNQALQKVKWLLKAQKAGHTGTLDPLATGVLPLCFGAATKFAQIHLDANKRYKALLNLGVVTSTGDSEGEVLSECEAAITSEQLAQVLPQFLGKIMQVPPIYSALKYQGKALYEYARAGIEVEREAREVEIFEISGVVLDPKTVELEVLCSKGTYIRTLASDIGDALGCGASLKGLQRISSGHINLSQCVSLDALEGLSDAAYLKLLKPPEYLLEGLPVVTLDEADAGRFLTGMRRKIDQADAELIQVMGERPKALLGIGEVKANELIPKRLLSPLEIKESLEQNIT